MEQQKKASIEEMKLQRESIKEDLLLMEQYKSEEEFNEALAQAVSKAASKGALERLIDERVTKRLTEEYMKSIGIPTES